MDSDLQAEIIELCEQAAAYLKITFEDESEKEHWLAVKLRELIARLEK